MAELPVPVHDPDAVRRAVEAVLARPEFAREKPNLWERITGWVSEQIGEILGVLLGSGSASTVGTVILTVTLFVALALAVWFARGVRRGGGQREPEPTVEAIMGPREWLEAAAEAEHAGRWREALRCRYRWLVAELDRLGAVEEEPGRTAGDYLDDVRRRAAGVAEPFEDATRAFEAVWYGGADVDTEALDALRETSERVVRSVEAGV